MDLGVWLHASRVARVREKSGRLRLEYTNEAFDGYELGSPVLSVSLPLVATSYPNGVTRAFLEGLLPEGAARNEIAAELGLVASNTYGLISALGRDCAGALVIQPEDEEKPPLSTTLTAERLPDDRVTDLIMNLRTAPLGVDERVRISLAGVQEKLLLTRMPDGSWGRPVDGTPSTHIIKPTIARFPYTVENEAFCMRVAQNLGLDVANVEVIKGDPVNALIVERYDRLVTADGAVERIHQEDFCQAMAILPKHKYQQDGGPSLTQIAGILESAASPESVEKLLQAVAFNVLIGNGDAHGKNFSLIHEREGSMKLAPLYDLLCTYFYGDDRLAMYVDDVRRIDRVSGTRLVNEAVSWGLSRRRAEAIVIDLLARTPDAIDAARSSTENLPDEIAEFLERQLQELATGLNQAA